VHHIDRHQDHWQESARLVGLLVWREIKDVLRDWRLVVPIVILTLLFPVLANFTAGEMMDFLNRYGGEIIGERFIPFLLMIVGFFPISFSLVIALETFVGEKERKSLEPLLATPLSDTQLYLGKTLASMIAPLTASYLGIAVYTIALWIFQGWTVPASLLLQIVALTTAEALVMVSGAVIISSQTTSARAANLLASFIIIPMALLVQGEAMIMFWARYEALWGILAFLLVGNVLLIRMGLRLFNREELLSREIDVMNVRRLWRVFRQDLRWDWWWFDRSPESLPRPLRWLGTLGGLYVREIPAIIRRSRLALLVILAGIVGSLFLGRQFALEYPLPSGLIFLGSSPTQASRDALLPGLSSMLAPEKILGHNLRALGLAALLGTFSFGSMAAITMLATSTIATYLGFQVAWNGHNVLLYFLALVAPHGVLEVPAAILASALAVRLGATFVAPPQDQPVGDAWLEALADFIKGFIAVVLPMLIVAAWIESNITPLIALRIYGG
jgi:ABC-type transport system involved in multi-copper enzyme maturation permease subunit